MLGLGLMLGALAGPDPGLPPRTHRVRHREVHDVAMRDGLTLRTVMLRPRGEGTFPTVFTRTPYAMGPVLAEQCRRIVRRGYACGWQEVRGRLHAEGTWRPMMNDEADGQDAVAWIVDQPWSDGQVGWLGDSYLAATGWAVALGEPDGVDVLVSRIFAPPLTVSAFEDGLIRHELATAWMAAMPDERNRLLGVGPDYHRALEHRPRTTMDVIAAGHPVPWFREWQTAEAPTDPFWQHGDPARFEQAPRTTTVPVMMVGGWSDAFIEAQYLTWQQLPDRSEAWWIVGPWAHLGQVPSAIPLKNIRGEGGGGGSMPQLPRVLDWLGTHLKGTEPRYPQHGVVTYVVGGDRWEIRDDWPPPTREQRWALLDGEAPCDGLLRQGAQPLQEPLSWTYDPEDPLPSRGGAGLLAGALPFLNGVDPGFVRHRLRCERRDDVLRFVSPPLDAPLHLAGVVHMELEVASDAPDTAFGFRLAERLASGKEIVLREGFATLALRDGPPRTPYEPGTRVVVRPDTQPLEAELAAGSSLVLVITSSSFPAVEAHPNTAGVLAEATTTRPAHQQLFAGTLVIPEVIRTAPGSVAEGD